MYKPRFIYVEEIRRHIVDFNECHGSVVVYKLWSTSWVSTLIKGVSAVHNI